jgi:hypothetical protein
MANWKITLAFLIISFNSFSQNNTVTVFNKTDFQIKSLHINGHLIGDIPANGQITVKKVSEFELNKAIPLNPVHAYIDEYKMDYDDRFVDINKYSSSKRGKYKFNILGEMTDSGYYLYYSKH